MKLSIFLRHGFEYCTVLKLKCNQDFDWEVLFDIKGDCFFQVFLILWTVRDAVSIGLGCIIIGSPITFVWKIISRLYSIQGGSAAGFYMKSYVSFQSVF